MTKESAWQGVDVTCRDRSKPLSLRPLIWQSATTAWPIPCAALLIAGMALWSFRC
jgi:hypothetical protein